MGKTYYISNYNFLIEHRSSSGFLPFPILALQMYILPNTYLPGFYGIGLYYFSFSILLFSSLGFFVFQLFSLYFLLYTKYKFVIFSVLFWAICLGIYWNLCCCCILFFSISNKMITTFFALSFFILLSLAFPSYIPTGDMYTFFSDFFFF